MNEVDGPVRLAHDGSDGCRELEWTTPMGPSSILFLNLDKIPTRIFGIAGGEPSDDHAVMVRVRRMAETQPALLQQFPVLGDRAWLVAELRRVIHANGIRTLAVYQDVERVGRGRGPRKHSDARKAVWQLLMETDGQLGSTRRMMAAADLLARGGKPARRFSHVFVDEFQDLTSADARILASLVPDANRLFFAGDAAQAMLLGATFDAPGSLHGSATPRRNRRRATSVLTHSYRMTHHIAAAVRPVATRLRDALPPGRTEWVGIPRGTRSGVIGVRPIVVASSPALQDDLAEIRRRYLPLFAAADPVTLADANRDTELQRVATAAFPDCAVRPGSMAAIKGLERVVVVWSTGDHWSIDEGALQFVYTVMTRAMSLLIIVVDTSSTDPTIVEALSVLDPETLLFWNSRARDAFETLVGGRADRDAGHD